MAKKDDKLQVYESGPYTIPGIERDGITPIISHVPIIGSYRGKLAYSGGGRIKILDMETGEKREYPGIRGSTAPAWHPDGQHIAFGGLDIFVLDSASGKFIRATRTSQFGNAETPSWSPDGKRLVYRKEELHESGLTILNMQTQEETHLSIEGFRLINPAWSPIGNFILCQSMGNRRTGLKAQIQLIGLPHPLTEPCQVSPLTSDDSPSTYPRWSPDGKQVVFVRRYGRYGAIHVMEANGANVQRITEPPSLYSGDFDPSWSSDGRHIVFAHFEHSRWYLYIMKADGSDVMPVSDGLIGGSPAWWMDMSSEETEG